jgi:hypothetical protein
MGDWSNGSCEERMGDVEVDLDPTIVIRVVCPHGFVVDGCEIENSDIGIGPFVAKLYRLLGQTPVEIFQRVERFGSQSRAIHATPPQSRETLFVCSNTRIWLHEELKQIPSLRAS